MINALAGIGLVLFVTLVVATAVSQKPLGWGFPPCTPENCKECDFASECEFKDELDD